MSLSIITLADMQVNITSTLFHRFPTEVALRILELGAASSKNTCLTLCLVSTQTRKLALPHLLSAVVLRDVQHLKDFARYMSITTLELPDMSTPMLPLKPLGAYAPQVRGLFVSDLYADAGNQVKYGEDLIPRILASCPNLTDLALTPSDAFALICTTTPSISGPHFIAIPARAELRLTILGFDHSLARIMDRILARVHDRSDMFTLVTQLRFIQGTQQGPVRAADGQVEHAHLTRCMALFPRLTHFATPLVPGPDITAMLESTLAQCSDDLQFFVMLLPDEQAPDYNSEFGQWLRDVRSRDLRLYFATRQPISQQREWRGETTTGSGETLWERSARQTKAWETRVNNF